MPARRQESLMLGRMPASAKDRLKQHAPRWLYRAAGLACRGKWPFVSGLGDVRTSDDLRVWQLEEKLWGGFTNVALAGLEDLRIDPAASTERAGLCALALARYYAASGEFERALDCIGFARARIRPLKRDRKTWLIQIYCLMALGRPADACRVARDFRRSGRSGGDLPAIAASVSAGRAEGRPGREAAEFYLNQISLPLRAVGLAGLALRDDKGSLSIANLASEGQPADPDSTSARVSVLMAVYNGAEHLEWAARGVLEQTWANLELILVDDASSDDSWAVIQRLVGMDDRVVAIGQERNGGAYVARNAALEQASGDYVTVNDVDDWPHPRKIETQVKWLMKSRRAIANLTDRVRVAADMTIQPRLDSPFLSVAHTDYSSLMVSRETALAMGGWDRVRFGADSEFIRRLEASEGKHAVEKVHAGVPLSFALVGGGNLTAASATSIWTHRFGARQVYARQSREWHRSGADLAVRRGSQLSPFPVPAVCYYGSGHEQRFDVIVVSDFGVLDDNWREGDDCLAELCRQGRCIAISAWPRFEATFKLGSGGNISRYCRQHGIVSLVHGEKAVCDLLLIARPVVMMHRIDQLPEIAAGRVAILTGDDADTYDRATVERNVVWAFGTAGEWMSGLPKL